MEAVTVPHWGRYKRGHNMQDCSHSGLGSEWYTTRP